MEGVGVSVTGAEHGAVVVERSGACLSVRAASAPAQRWLEPMLSAEPGRTAVVVDGSAAAALYALDRRLLAGLHRHLSPSAGGPASGLRLLVGGAARSGGDGSPPVAARLADELGVEVVAPDGPLVVLGRGELFSAGPTGAWWGFAPGRPAATPAGSRFPPPAWQRDLPPGIALRPPSPQVTVTPVPSGLWVRGVGGPAAELSDPAFAVPPSPGRLAVLAGRPGEAPPPVAGLAEVVRALPPPLRQRYLLVPYGPEPAGEVPVAQRLADQLHADVLATQGLPSYTADGSLDFAVLDGAGRSTWRPFVSQSVYHPGPEPPAPWAWSPPLADLQGAGPASFWLADGWVVDVLPSGLLVRPATSAPESLVLRRPADPQRIDVIMTAAVLAPGNVPVFVLGALGRLVRALPPDMQDRLRLLITERVDPPEVVGLAGALRVPVHRLGGDGISPVQPAAAHPAEGVPQPAAVGPADPRPDSVGPADPRPDSVGPADPRPDSVGRLHASAVPTTSVPAAAPSQPLAGADSATLPSKSTVDESAAAAAGPPATQAPPEAVPGPTGAGAERQVTIRADGRIRAVRGQQRGSGNEPSAGGEPVPPTAAPADHTPPAPHPPGPGRPPAPRPHAAPSPAPAGAAPPPSPPPAEQPPHSAPTQGGLPPAQGRPPERPLAAAPGQPWGPPVPPPAAAAPLAGAAPPVAAPPVAAPLAGAAPPVAAAPVAAAPVAAPRPVAGLVPVAPDRAGGADQWWQKSSTPPERQQFRLSLGWRYDAASRYVRQMLSERPSLRAAAAADDGIATDLAAVHVFATSDHTGLLESLRTGAVQQVDRAFVSCLVSGLRRLPTLTGLVVRGGPDDPAVAEAYRQGRDVVEMGLLMAVADSQAQVPGGVEVLIWSSTARRLDGLVEGAEAAKVVFLPGTVFRVLDVHPASEPRRVLLAEMPQNWRSRVDAARDERIRDRLRTAAQARTADPADGDQADGDRAGDAEEPPPRHRWTSPSLVALPGLVPVESLRGAA